MDVKTSGGLMELTVSRIELLNGIDRVIGAVDKRAVRPLHTHLKLDVYLTRLEISATDTMVYARTECPVVAELGGAVAVPAEKLRAAVDKSAAEIRITLVDGLKLNLDSEGRHFDLPCLDADDFPNPLGGDPEPMYVLGHGILPGIIKGLKHAVCGDEQKPHLCGIHLISEGGRVTACATDGHRLSVAGREIPGAGHTAFAFTVPSRACNMLADINSSIELALSANNNLVQFDSGKNDICSRLLEGKFPDFRKAVPASLDKGCTIGIQALIEALESCGVMGDDKNKSVQLAGDDGVLSLTTLGPSGTATMTLPYMGDDGLALRINSRYLLQAVRSLGGEELFLKYKDELSPIMLIPVDHGSWDERLEVIVPLRG